MNILVTGGIGRIGRATVAYLLKQGHFVRILDRDDPADIKPEVLALIQGADYQQVDITDYASLRSHFNGIDAVVHLAAIPSPLRAHSAEIFGINGGGAFNVYQSAVEAGIQRVVSASSINALGNKYGIHPTPIRYFPIDEVHPTWTSDVYSFSKTVVEETATYFWRREGVLGVCMRFPWVYDTPWFLRNGIDNYYTQLRQTYQALQALSESARQEALQSALARHHALRRLHQQRKIDYGKLMQETRKIPYHQLFFVYQDFWAMLDMRDATYAIYLALTVAYEDNHILNIADAYNATGLPSKDLAALFYPEVTTWKKPISGTETLFSIDKARALLGYEPQHSLIPPAEVAQ